MQDAYEDFVKQIVTISNSEDYTHVFRMLNLTRIEIAPLVAPRVGAWIETLMPLIDTTVASGRTPCGCVD